MVKVAQLMWAFLAATGAVADRFGNVLELRTNSSYIIEAETTAFLGNLPESREPYVVVWTALEDREKDVLVQASGVNNGPGCGGSLEQWCIFAGVNLGDSLPEEKREIFAPGFAMTPGPSYKIHSMATEISSCMRLCSADEEKGQIDLSMSLEGDLVSNSTISMPASKPTVWMIVESALLDFTGKVREHSYVNATIVLGAPDPEFSRIRRIDQGITGEWFTTDNKTFTAPKLTVAEFNFTN